MHYDLGSKRFKCDPPGWTDSCRPGCPGEWCENGQFWECGFKPNRLVEMMNLHDKEGIGHVENTKYNGCECATDANAYACPDTCPDTPQARQHTAPSRMHQAYTPSAYLRTPRLADNEVVLDALVHPWEAELADIAMATFIQVEASPAAKSYGETPSYSYLAAH